MKISFRLLSLAYFIAFTFNANLSYSQIRFGPKAGLNFSELPNNTRFIVGTHHIYSGFHLGAMAELKLFKELYLQPGVLLTDKGSNYIVGNNSGGTTTGFSNFQLSSLYIDIPLNLIYKFDMGYFNLFLITGPQLGYGLTGKWEASSGATSEVHFGNEPVDDLKPFDYGLDFGAGVEIGRLQVSSQYYMGLRTLSTLTPPLEEQKYKVLSISIAYLFGKEKKGYKHFRNELCRTYDQHKGHRKKHY